MSVNEPTQLRQWRAEFQANPALAERILSERPSVKAEPDRAIRCSSEHAERGTCRAIARAVVDGEIWRIEMEKAQ